MRVLLGRFLALHFALLGSVFATSANAQTASELKLGKVSEARSMGTFRYVADRELVPVVTPQGEPAPISWFQAELSDGWWTNLGANALVNPNPPGLPRAFNEFVSHGQGITPGTTVTGFRVFWVSGGSDPDFFSPFVDFQVSFYDGRDETNTPKAPIAQFVLSFDFTIEEQPLNGWFADIILDPVDQFVLPNADFEYGLKLVDADGSINFGPFLHQNITDQMFGLEADAEVGKTYCLFERWAAPAPTTPENYGQFNLVDGTHNGGPFWFGNTPPVPPADPAPWAAANFSVFYEPVISGSVDATYVIHNGYSGGGSNVDTGKSLHKETATPTQLTYDNLINSSRGINGVGLDMTGTGNIAAITAADFEFQMSPVGAFDAVANPPVGWAAAPAPTSVVPTAGTPDTIAIAWADNAIANRWLRVTVKANANTGLGADEVYYIGHLLGEAGPTASPFTVSFADISPIRAGVGATVNADSILDIDKNGTVAFQDITSMRANVGAQLTTITVPPLP